MNNAARHVVSNRLSLAGIVLATAGFLGTTVLGIIEFASASSHGPYFSIFAWIIFPTIFYVGIVGILLGIMRERTRRHRVAPDRVSKYFDIDLNRARVRKIGYACALLLMVVLVFTGVTSYHAYEFSESTTFCASSCHVMAPERVTHQISPHAQVACSSCHVGRTPAQYAQAKLYGMKELYSLVTKTYPKPIPTPIHAMQPVRENCTGCHWERLYWGKLHRDYSHYIAANDNQQWVLKMNVKVGGMHRFGGEGEGIHWHMKLNPKVSYVATDERLQKIPWVRVIDEVGKETIYRSKDDPVSESDLPRYPVREMTCIDCHNRPAHRFRAPILAIDDAMARGYIDPAITGVKAKAVELLAAPGYTTQDQAVASIREKFMGHYRDQYPEIFKTQKPKLDRVAQVLDTLYRQNFFPEMKSDWRAYPDNIGHFLSDGCFRCHDGLHVSDKGKVVSNDCSLCHDIVVQGPRDAVEANAAGLAFRHPVDFGTPIQEMGKCTQCHDGTLGPDK